jgi:hypothetical protein
MSAPAGSDSLDWDEASHAVADAYFPHELHPLTRSTAANVVVDSVGIGPVRIAHIGWGAAVTVDTAHPGGFTGDRRFYLSNRDDAATASRPWSVRGLPTSQSALPSVDDDGANIRTCRFSDQPHAISH